MTTQEAFDLVKHVLDADQMKYHMDEEKRSFSMGFCSDVMENLVTTVFVMEGPSAIAVLSSLGTAIPEERRVEGALLANALNYKRMGIINYLYDISDGLITVAMNQFYDSSLLEGNAVRSLIGTVNEAVEQAELSVRTLLDPATDFTEFLSNLMK